MAAFRHLRFSEIRKFNYRYGVEAKHHVILSADQSNRLGDMADFRFSKIAALRHFGFVYACLDHPRRIFGDLCDCAKFDCNQRINLGSMQVLIFYGFCFKIINAPKIGVFGGFYPTMGCSMN